MADEKSYPEYKVIDANNVKQLQEKLAEAAKGDFKPLLFNMCAVSTNMLYVVILEKNK